MMFYKQLYFLLWVLFVHLAGIYLFTKGFLLNRLQLPDTTTCVDGACTSLSSHKKAVLLVIDALRFDFISDHPPHPVSQYHHNILTLPRELSAQHPDRSFIFNAYADPPTTTTLRIKGLSTGSIPTFVDLGSNFGGAVIDEDNLIHQLRASGRKIAFVGDNAWTTAFPGAFDVNMTYPYDSFNVEDLHTVDEGVIEHLLPMLEDRTLPWDFVIAHGLGVDHAAHRVGPDHPAMRAKLAQMNDLLASVVDRLDDDTLLVVIGDHGMDNTGNHGGDSALETLSAVWIYSKVPLQSQHPSPIPQSILPTMVFPGATVPDRFIQQIDLVPSLSLILGLPIPFNNLGSIIPELFDRDAEHRVLEQALNVNAAQIRKYTETYRTASSRKELESAWTAFQTAWASTQTDSLEKRLAAMYDYNRLVLSTCRTLWAQFNTILIGGGLAVIGVGVIAGFLLYFDLDNDPDTSERLLRDQRWRLLVGVIAGAVSGAISYPLLNKFEGITAISSIVFGSAFVSCIAIITSSRPSISFKSLKSLSLPLILHTLCFASNSFTIWEENIVPFLLLTTMIPNVMAGLTAPTPRLRYHILGYSAVFAVSVRLMALSTVCREEQQSYCLVSFYASPSSSAPPTIALLLALPLSFMLPRVIKHHLSTSKSDGGLAAIFLPYILTPGLLAGSLFWILEWVHSSELFDELVGEISRVIRTLLATSTIFGMLVVGLVLWYTIPLCLDIQRNGESVAQSEPTDASQNKRSNKQVTVLGFANAFGSPYLIFWTIFFIPIWAMTQLTGQLVLGFMTIAVLAHLEIVDGVRDVTGLNVAFASADSSAALDLSAVRGSLSFSEIVPIALLGIHAFHGTGHQPTIPSVQWKTAFILTKNVVFPLSQATVILNTLGPYVLIGLASPLLILWNLPPLPSPSLSIPPLRVALGVSLYYFTLLLGSAGSAAALRRHLMVWKIFAPRYVFASMSLIAVDVGVLVGVLVGVWRVRERVSQVFRAIA